MFSPLRKKTLITQAKFLFHNMELPLISVTSILVSISVGEECVWGGVGFKPTFEQNATVQERHVHSLNAESKKLCLV